MQKINVFWIAQSLVYLEPFLFYQPGDFWRFRGDFRKKYDFKKKFFFKIFFWNFCKSLFLSLIWRDLKKKIFLKISKKIFENLSFWKKYYFGQYFWFLIGFTHTNNLSQVLLSWLFKKFLCDMYSHWLPMHLYLPVCSWIPRIDI